MAYYHVAVEVLHYYEVDARTSEEAIDMVQYHWQDMAEVNHETIEAYVVGGSDEPEAEAEDEGDDE